MVRGMRSQLAPFVGVYRGTYATPLSVSMRVELGELIGGSQVACDSKSVQEVEVFLIVSYCGVLIVPVANQLPANSGISCFQRHADNDWSATDSCSGWITPNLVRFPLAARFAAATRRVDECAMTQMCSLRICVYFIHFISAHFCGSHYSFSPSFRYSISFTSMNSCRTGTPMQSLPRKVSL